MFTTERSEARQETGFAAFLDVILNIY